MILCVLEKIKLGTMNMESQGEVKKRHREKMKLEQRPAAYETASCANIRMVESFWQRKNVWKSLEAGEDLASPRNRNEAIVTGVWYMRGKNVREEIEITRTQIV